MLFLQRFLDGVQRHMTLRHFTDPPISFELPEILIQRNREGQPVSHRFILRWPNATHSLLFYLLFKDYHYSSEGGEEATVLQLECDSWRAIRTERETVAILQNRETVDPEDFMEYIDILQQRRAIML